MRVLGINIRFFNDLVHLGHGKLCALEGSLLDTFIGNETALENTLLGGLEGNTNSQELVHEHALVKDLQVLLLDIVPHLALEDLVQLGARWEGLVDGGRHGEGAVLVDRIGEG